MTRYVIATWVLILATLPSLFVSAKLTIAILVALLILAGKLLNDATEREFQRPESPLRKRPWRRPPGF